jgi:hypothetical protein
MKPAEPQAPPPRFGRRRLAGAAVLTLALGAALGLALLAAACGGGSSSAKVAQIGTTGTGNGSESSSNSSLGDPLAFSACMRSHGFPSFPDPDSTGRIHIPTGSAIDESSAEYQSALRACHSLVPSLSTQQEARLQEQALHFAACMPLARRPEFSGPIGGTRPHSDPALQARSRRRSELPCCHRGRRGMPEQAHTRQQQVRGEARGCCRWEGQEVRGEGHRGAVGVTVPISRNGPRHAQTTDPTRLQTDNGCRFPAVTGRALSVGQERSLETSDGSDPDGTA